MSNELPDPWGKELGPKGVHSLRDLARVIESSPETARRLVNGGRTSPATVNKVADRLLGGDRDKVWSMYGVALQDHGDWQLPDGSSLLTEDQRAAVLAVVRAMLPAQIKREEAS